jgi:hypothetical protein
MNPAVQGALWGLGIGAFLVLVEYLMLSKGVRERAERYKRKPEFDVTERRRISSVTRFAVLLPPAFAFGFWLIWG